MNQYHIDFQPKKTVIVKLTTMQGNKEIEALIDYPQLQNEIELPVNYPVTAPDGKLLGRISSYLPDRKRINWRNGIEHSTLAIGGNEELILQTHDNNQRYDIGKLDLADLAESEADELKKFGFTHGYKLRSSAETGTLQFFEKDGKTRASLQTNRNFIPFLPVLMYEKIKNDLEGRVVKKSIPIKKELKQKKEVEEGPFARYVKENFSPRILEDAFIYQDQDGEKDRLFEYLDHGVRPVILNGPTGNGKTVLSRHYAHSRGVPFYFDTGSSSFRLSTAVGKFVPSPGDPTFSPGSLTLAAIFGGVYVLEEMPPIPQDELTGLNIFLETGELPLITQFGHELITAHPNFKFVATGNFHSNYTQNELNDAFLQRFSQIKLGYPKKENTVDIIQARTPGLDLETAETIANVIEDMRKEAAKFSKDLGLKGAVELAQRIRMGTDIPIQKLFEDNVVNPLTTYESNIEKRDGKLYTALMEVVRKHLG